MSNYLDFEKPIEELYEQLEKTKQIGTKGKIDVNNLLSEIEEKIQVAKKQIYSTLTPWQRVQLSRHPDRPYTLDFINAITDNTFIELHGDRNVKDDKAMVGGLVLLTERQLCLLASKRETIPSRDNIETSACPILKVIVKHCA